MRPLSECRTYEVLTPDGAWEPVQWTQLDEGDIIRCAGNDKPLGFPAGPEDTLVIAEQPHLLCDRLSVLRDRK